jgi:hypothetical protein
MRRYPVLNAGLAPLLGQDRLASVDFVDQRCSLIHELRAGVFKYLGHASVFSRLGFGVVE